MKYAQLALIAAMLIVCSSALAQQVLITTPTVVGPTELTIAGVPLGSADITVRGTTLTVNGRHTIAGLRLERGATNQPGILTHDAGFSHNYGSGGPDVASSHILASTPVFVRTRTVLKPRDSMAEVDFDAARRGRRTSTQSHYVDGKCRILLAFACTAQLDSMLLPGMQVGQGETATSIVDINVKTDTKRRLSSTSIESIRGTLASRAKIQMLRDGLAVNLFAYKNNQLLVGRITNRHPEQVVPELTVRDDKDDGVGTWMSVEWSLAPATFGENAVLLVHFGPRWQQLIMDSLDVESKLLEEAAYARGLLSGMPVSCSHCTGRGKLTGADRAVMLPAEIAEFDRRVSALAATVTNTSVVRARIEVGCSVCGGSGSRGVRQISAPLRRDLMDHIEGCERVAKGIAPSVQCLHLLIQDCKDNPAGKPDLDARHRCIANSEESLNRLKEELVTASERRARLIAELRD